MLLQILFSVCALIMVEIQHVTYRALEVFVGGFVSFRESQGFPIYSAQVGGADLENYRL